MSLQPLSSRVFSRKSGFFSICAVFAACALVAVASVPTVKAQSAAVTGSCQTAIENYLSTHSAGTIVTSSSTALANAVAMVIKSNTNAALLPEYFADAAILPYPYGANGSGGAVRTNVAPSFNRDAAAILVTGSAIAQEIITGTNSKINTTTFSTNIALTARSLIDLNGTNSATNLTSAGRIEVLSAALTALNNGFAPAPAALKTNVYDADFYMGQLFLADPFLEGLPSNGLTTLLAGGIVGITGTNPANSVYIANNFFEGLLTTGTDTFSWPNKAQGLSSSAFTLDILANISSNAPVDTYFAHGMLLRIYNNNSSNMGAAVSFGEALVSAYAAKPGVQIALSQGLVGGITAGTLNETQRITFVENLTTAEVASAASIEQGAIYTDPYYAGGFTNGIFASIHGKSEATLVADAPAIASDAGIMLGADGNVLTQVANIFGNYIANGLLSATNAGTYATNLIKGAQNSTIAAFGSDAWGNGGGGKLNLTQGSIAAGTVTDLASIADVMADGIVRLYGSAINTTGATAAAAEIGALAEAVAKITGNSTVSDTHSKTDSVGVFIAATLDNYIVGLSLGSTAQTDILNAIKADIEAVVTNSTYDSQIATAETDAAAKNGSDNYAAITGPISVQETTITNL